MSPRRNAALVALVALLALAIVQPCAIHAAEGDAGPNSSDAAAEQRAWTGGSVVLGDAVMRLTQNGNDTLLDMRVDPDRSAELPSASGSYWQDVVALCEAFGLSIAPAEQHHGGGTRHWAQQRSGIALCGGPVLLRPREVADEPLPLLIPQGSGLIRIEDAALARSERDSVSKARCGVALRLRLEPRIALDGLGTPRLHWTQAFDDTQQSLDVGGEGEGDHRNRVFMAQRMHHRIRMGGAQAEPTEQPPTTVVVDSAERDPRSLQLIGQVEIPVLQEYRCQVVLVPGQRQRLPLAGQHIEVWLLDDERARAAEWRRGGVGMRYRHDLMQFQGQPQLSATDLDGQVLNIHGHHSSSDQHWRGFYRYLGDVSDQPYVIELVLKQLERTDGISLDFTVPMP